MSSSAEREMLLVDGYVTDGNGTTARTALGLAEDLDGNCRVTEDAAAEFAAGVVTPAVGRPRAREPAGVIVACGEAAEAQAPGHGDGTGVGNGCAVAGVATNARCANASACAWIGWCIGYAIESLTRRRPHEERCSACNHG